MEVLDFNDLEVLLSDQDRSLEDWLKTRKEDFHP